MKKLKNLLPAIFGARAVQEPETTSTEVSDTIDQGNNLPTYGFEDWQQAARFSNTLLLLVPTQEMADMAFDDFYPAFFFALQRFEKAKHAGVSEGNKMRVEPGNYKGLPVKADANTNSVIAQYYELQEKLKASIDYDPQTEKGSVDEQEFMSAIFDHIDILEAMHTALHMPIEKIPEIRSTALAAPEKPLKDDLVTDRYGRAYSHEYLEEFLGLIEWARENVPEAKRHNQLDRDYAQRFGAPEL